MSKRKRSTDDSSDSPDSPDTPNSSLICPETCLKQFVINNATNRAIDTKCPHDRGDVHEEKLTDDERAVVKELNRLFRPVTGSTSEMTVYHFVTHSECFHVIASYHPGLTADNVLLLVNENKRGVLRSFSVVAKVKDADNIHIKRSSDNVWTIGKRRPLRLISSPGSEQIRLVPLGTDSKESEIAHGDNSLIDFLSRFARDPVCLPAEHPFGDLANFIAGHAADPVADLIILIHATHVASGFESVFTRPASAASSFMGNMGLIAPEFSVTFQPLKETMAQYCVSDWHLPRGAPRGKALSACNLPIVLLDTVSEYVGSWTESISNLMPEAVKQCYELIAETLGNSSATTGIVGSLGARRILQDANSVHLCTSAGCLRAEALDRREFIVITGILSGVVDQGELDRLCSLIKNRITIDGKTVSAAVATGYLYAIGRTPSV